MREFDLTYSPDCSYSKEVRKVSKKSSYDYMMDVRLNIIVPRGLECNFEHLRNYMNHICEVVNSRDNYGYWDHYVKCGFLPIGIEPSFWFNAFNPDVLKAMNEIGMKYYTTRVSSPKFARLEFDSPGFSTAQDIWVNKLDAAKFVNKDIHTISVKDVLEVVWNEID